MTPSAFVRAHPGLTAVLAVILASSCDKGLLRENVSRPGEPGFAPTGDLPATPGDSSSQQPSSSNGSTFDDADAGVGGSSSNGTGGSSATGSGESSSTGGRSGSDSSRPSMSGTTSSDGGANGNPRGEGGRTSSGGSNATGGTTTGGPPPTPTVPFTKRSLLAGIAECATASYLDFEIRAERLAEACEQLAATGSEDDRLAAQGVWRDAMASWQRAELFQLGPAAASTTAGGLDLRDQIYVFPLANPCLVDQQIVDGAYASASFGSSLASARGMSALEYVLFYSGSVNSCPSVISINSQGTWAMLGAAELAQRRADYAYAAARDAWTNAIELVDAWDAASGDFYGELVDAGQGSDLYASQSAAFDAMNAALFYVETDVKDLKLGWPLGLVPDCVNAPATCPTATESRFARVSTDHLRQNLVGLSRAFLGCEAGGHIGFDDWLADEDATSLAERMTEALQGAQQAVDTLTPPVEEAIVSDPSQVAGVHAAVKRFTDLLKTEFVSILGLQVPPTAAGDND